MLAGLKARAFVKCLPGGKRNGRKAGGVGMAQGARLGGQQLDGNGNQLGIGPQRPARQSGIDLISSLERRALWCCAHNAGDIETHDLRKCQGKGRVELALPHDDLDRIEPRRADLDQRVASSGNRVGDLPVRDH